MAFITCLMIDRFTRLDVRWQSPVHSIDNDDDDDDGDDVIMAGNVGALTGSDR